MDRQVSWLVEVDVKSGQLETFKTLVEDMVESTSREPGTLSYEWFITDDGTLVHIYERYADSDALVTHFQGFLDKFAERFSASVDLKRFSVYGEPSDEAREALAGLNPIYLGTLGGFVR
jgi:quinol monooxygenase YgiN